MVLRSPPWRNHGGILCGSHPQAVLDGGRAGVAPLPSARSACSCLRCPARAMCAWWLLPAVTCGECGIARLWGLSLATGRHARGVVWAHVCAAVRGVDDDCLACMGVQYNTHGRAWRSASHWQVAPPTLHPSEPAAHSCMLCALPKSVHRCATVARSAGQRVGKPASQCLRGHRTT